MADTRRRYTKKDVFIRRMYTSILLVLVFVLSYYAFISYNSKSQLDELTTSYISFNNNDTTDMMKITNLKKMSNSNGVSFKNKSMKRFEVSGEIGERYQIVLYHIGNVIDNKYVHYSLVVNNKVKETNVLSNVVYSENGGLVIYDGKIEKNNNCILKMWVDNSYRDSVKNVSYEVRIK